MKGGREKSGCCQNCMRMKAPCKTHLVVLALDITATIKAEFIWGCLGIYSDFPPQISLNFRPPKCILASPQQRNQSGIIIAGNESHLVDPNYNLFPCWCSIMAVPKSFFLPLAWSLAPSPSPTGHRWGSWTFSLGQCFLKGSPECHPTNLNTCSGNCTYSAKLSSLWLN